MLRSVTSYCVALSTFCSRRSTPASTTPIGVSMSFCHSTWFCFVPKWLGKKDATMDLA
jgi:hypothetical protein